MSKLRMVQLCIRAFLFGVVFVCVFVCVRLCVGTMCARGAH